MPLDSSTVGGATNPMEHSIDARWLMAYAAGIGDLNPVYMDTAAGTVAAHPVFPVCIEWPVILNAREIAGSHSLSLAESARGVHAAHDLHIYRPIRDGDHLATQATMINVRSIKPGAAYTLRLDTTDVHSGDLVARTYQLGIYRGVEVSGGDRSVEEAPAWPKAPELDQAHNIEIDVAVGAAHTYTECARIWNPIHTDRAVALSAGLPDIILHGPATLGLAVSRVVDHFAEGKPALVSRLGGRFSAMVLMPSTITLQAQRIADTVFYQVLTEDGQTAISNGFVVLE